MFPLATFKFEFPLNVAKLAATVLVVAAPVVTVAVVVAGAMIDDKAALPTACKPPCGAGG